MKRKVEIMSLVLTMSSVAAIANPTEKAPFVDVEYHWARDYVSHLAKEGIVKGYGSDLDGYLFKPDNSISREEASAIISRRIGSSDASNEHTFKDVSGWSEEAISHLQSLGIIEGTSEDMFEPTREITRAEFATIMKRYIDSSDIEMEKGEPKNFADVSGHWAEEKIKEMSSIGIIEGVGNGLFAPQKNISRAEVTAMIARIDGIEAQMPEIPVIPNPDENEGEIWNERHMLDVFQNWWFKDRSERSQGNKLGKTYPDGWTAPKLQSKWSNNMERNQWILHNELGFNAPDPHTIKLSREDGRPLHFPGNWEGVENMMMPLRVIDDNPRSYEVMIDVRQWERDNIPQTYRVPIIYREVLKLYFEENWEEAYDKTLNVKENFFMIGDRPVAIFKGRVYTGYKGQSLDVLRTNLDHLTR